MAAAAEDRSVFKRANNGQDQTSIEIETNRIDCERDLIDRLSHEHG